MAIVLHTLWVQVGFRILGFRSQVAASLYFRVLSRD